MSELFPTRIRGRAMSIATISLWLACVALTFTFLSLVKASASSGAFCIYGAMCVVTVFFVWRVTPETKGARSRRSSASGSGINCEKPWLLRSQAQRELS